MAPTSVGSFIGGGAGHTITDSSTSVITGGQTNTITGGVHCFIGCGNANTLDSTLTDFPFCSAIVCGNSNTITIGDQSAILAGYNNTITGNQSSILGGANNNITLTRSSILGGNDNTITSNLSFSAGSYTTITEDDCVALGTNVTINHYKCFVWGDGSANTASSTTNQMVIRSSGGVKFFTNSGTAGAELAASSTAWSVICDRDLKQNIEELDYADTLRALQAVKVYKFNYVGQDAGIVTRGPMADEWNTAFISGKSPNSIETIDLDGVALASIKGLAQAFARNEAVVDALSATVDGLKAANAALSETLAQHERNMALLNTALETLTSRVAALGV
jgi:hypothetical protein